MCPTLLFIVSAENRWQSLRNDSIFGSPRQENQLERHRRSLPAVNLSKSHFLDSLSESHGATIHRGQRSLLPFVPTETEYICDFDFQFTPGFTQIALQRVLCHGDLPCRVQYPLSVTLPWKKGPQRMRLVLAQRLIPGYTIPYSRNFSSHLRGCRVGEALHPGPHQVDGQLPAYYKKRPYLTITAVNPTAIFNKEDIFTGLNSDVYCMSETSATRYIQKVMQSRLSTIGYKTIWGAPAKPHRFVSAADDHPDKRGLATGVSIHARLPLRASRQEEYREWETQGRLVRAFLCAGTLEIQMICLYGIASSNSNARQKTESLLSAAMQLAMETDMPTIIAGDLNHKPENLPTWRTMQHHGWRHTFELYQEKYKSQMPYTYLQTSWPDMMMFSPQVAHLVESISVDQTGWVAGHHPLTVRLALPSKPCTKTTWRQPHSWLPYGPPTMLIENHYHKSSPAQHLLQAADVGPSIAFKHWGECIEKAVSCAIAEQHMLQPEHQPYSALPRNAHGRCQLPKIVEVPQQRTIKPAWNGHFTPTLNTAPIRVRQQTRQIRRIQSLKARVGKLTTYPEIWPGTWEQLHLEWRAILQAPGYQGGFPQWLQRHPELPDPDRGLPDFNGLHDIEQLLKYEIHTLEKQAQKFQRELKQYHRWFDKKHGNLKQAFSSIREEGHGCLQTAQIQSRTMASMETNQQLGLVKVQLRDRLPLRPDLPVFLHGQKATMISYEHPYLKIMPDEVEQTFPQQCEVLQKYSTSEPTLVGNALTTYWNAFWQRDKPQEQTQAEPWSAFSQILDQLPELPPLHLDLTDRALWRDAIKAVKSYTATLPGVFAASLQMNSNKFLA